MKIHELNQNFLLFILNCIILMNLIILDNMEDHCVLQHLQEFLLVNKT